MICHIEIFLDSVWQPAASFESMGDEALGATGKARLCYDPAYVVNNQGRREAALSSLSPVTFEWDTESQRWPAFMLDILPTGAARRTCSIDWNRTCLLMKEPTGGCCKSAAATPSATCVSQGDAPKLLLVEDLDDAGIPRCCRWDDERAFQDNETSCVAPEIIEARTPHINAIIKSVEPLNPL